MLQALANRSYNNSIEMFDFSSTSKKKYLTLKTNCCIVLRNIKQIGGVNMDNNLSIAQDLDESQLNALLGFL
ncbi:hypothetical protein OMAG_000648, partial [Candidatus Omnitrophus magneticus]